MSDDTEALIWAMRDIHAGALPRPARFSHNGKRYCATFKRSRTTATVTLKDTRTKTERTCTIKPQDFMWAEDMVRHVLKACPEE